VIEQGEGRRRSTAGFRPVDEEAVPGVVRRHEHGEPELHLPDGRVPEGLTAVVAGGGGTATATATPRPPTVPFIVSVGPAAGGPAARVAAASGDAVVVSSDPGGRLLLRVVPTTRPAPVVVDVAPVAIVVCT
jgi:hypothetical protein